MNNFIFEALKTSCPLGKEAAYCRNRCTSFMRSSVGFACREAIFFYGSGVVEEDADDLSDELELIWVSHWWGVVDVLVLLAIFDGMVHKCGVDIFLVFGDSESDEGILDIIGDR